MGYTFNLIGGDAYTYAISFDVVSNLPPQPPTLTGNTPTLNIDDNETATPFDQLAFSDIDSSGGTITITYNSANGTLSGTGLSGVAGSYTLTGGTNEELTARLQALQFTPTENQLPTGQTTPTSFTLTPYDGENTGIASTVSLSTLSVNDPPSGTVTLTGNPQEGEKLTASNDLDDPDGLGDISYQWLRNGTAIEGATGETYLLTQADVGSTISVTASYTDGFGTLESVTSDVTANVENLNDAPTGSVTIAGQTQQGSTLTADNTLADPDGLGEISYQWLRDGQAIEGATGSSYTLTQEDVDSTISVTASYTDGFGTLESVTSDVTANIENVNDAPTGSVTITGQAQQGSELTADNTLADLDGLGEISYQWLRNGQAIEGATGATYTLTQEDVSAAISVTASYIDGFGTLESVTSDVTANIENVNDDPTGSVTISGTVQQGQTLLATHTLNDLDGLGEISYQWFKDGNPIDGAINEQYTLTENDIGSVIYVQARYTDGFNTQESVLSAVTEAVQPRPATPTPPPPTESLTPSGQPIVVDTIENTSGDAQDTALIQNTGSGNTVSVVLPSGTSLTSSGGQNAVSGQSAINDLVSIIESNQPGNVNQHSQLASLWLNNLQQLLIDIREITLQATTQPFSPIVFTGNGNSNTALVINTHNLIAGSQIQLDDIQFASIIGSAYITGGAGNNIVIGDDAEQNIVLGPGDDILYGGGGNDTIGSLEGNDRLYGEAGDDLLFSDYGSNVFHGGLDQDTVRYSGNQDEYTIVQEHTLFKVYHRDAPAEVDTLINIERIEFADTTQLISYADEISLITGLYANILGRQADVEGIQHWASMHSQGISLANITLNLLLSEEAGSLLPENDDAAIEWLYQGLFNRSADTAGKAYWAEQLALNNELTTVVDGLLSSAEMDSFRLSDTEWSFIG